ncbi:hypothetical protein M408DRAFT_19323 [Serendipita vermifera MAFF 305830]|uniref:Uncharacterized protein n=1 Tax=Serendipita vermifera MAFF 305830 TaxID=933852 RepID=A0A0C3BQN5_SERVB|nr:hypothetical protein M408DRAFT_19323 [Serendipita vermifera MAFF 305830]
MANTQEPPTYTQLPDTQLLIVPSSNSIQFQNGFLGVDETNSVEGEVHVKGAMPGDWSSLTISLVTVERDQSSVVQLASHTVELYDSLPSSAPGTSANIVTRPPTTSYFSIPLTTDTPQALRTPLSSLSHQLIAKLTSTDPARKTLTTSQDIDIRRYSSPDPSLTPLVPKTYTLDSPVRVELQIPRLTYRLGEVIPVYVTIPVPTTEQVTYTGIRLRNLKVELIRVVKILSSHSEGTSETSSSASASVSGSSSMTAHRSADSPLRSSFASDSPPYVHTLRLEGHVSPRVDRTVDFRTALTRSGAPARFHSSRPVRIRLLARTSAAPSSPAQVPIDSASHSTGVFDCPITQSTTLHTVEFFIEVSVSFLRHRTHQAASEHLPVQESTTISVPITILPPLAKTLEAVGDMDMEHAYHKKFDKPPTKTNREAAADVGPPGPSASGAPPPFDDRDAPPPPFMHSESQQSQAGTSHLPTFLESEAHYVVPLPGPSNSSQMPYAGYTSVSTSSAQTRPSAVEEDPDRVLEIEGEGRLFGFRPEEQFDGLEATFGGGAEPPPAIENVQDDTDVTALADLVDRPERALEAIGRGMGVVTSEVDPSYGTHIQSDIDRLEHALQMNAQEEAPAPPFVDDPADPPPGIDMEFRTSPPPFPPPHADSDLAPPHTPPADPPPSIEDAEMESPIASQTIGNPSFRPPPYLNTTAPTDGQHGPPPYVDLR